MVRLVRQKKRQALAKLREGCTWDEAAEAVGVGRATLFRWVNSDPEFAKGVEEAKAGPDAEVEAITYGNCTDPDPANNALRMFWLKCRKPDRYKDRVGIDVNEPGYFEQGKAANLRPPAETEGVP